MSNVVMTGERGVGKTLNWTEIDWNSTGEKGEGKSLVWDIDWD